MTITKGEGELTKTPSRIFAEAAHRCIPGSQLITFPTARHGASWQNSPAFNAAYLHFLRETDNPTNYARKRLVGSFLLVVWIPSR